MTERVQSNLERMIPELEDYKDRGIFTSNELQKIISTRKKHEFRLQRLDKKLLDIMRYIESETSLEKIRDKRLKKMNVDPSLYDRKISERVVELYKNALYRFNDKNIITHFAEYATRKRLFVEMKQVFANFCLKHPLDIDLWIFCASKLFEIDDVDSSRAMFLKGIRINQNDMRLRVEFFRMEILYIGKINMINKEMGIDDDDKDEVEKGDIAFNIFLDSLETFQDINLLSEMIELSKNVKEVNDRITECLNR
ncbi:U3 small nucleolar RNA-associated protein 6-like [Pieris brassicae]|uniref:U3 small nucleolar RNA-associated protein 6-like n=1 Tax=Pieris brassicae TaxID=7116 RepID=UPI001E65E52E|nr:U3 small nucleolar RNA-associated protein 6-like [Pieris brassicae]